MIAVLKRGTNDKQIADLKAWIESQGLQVHLSKGDFQTIVGLVGDTSRIDEDLVMPVEQRLFPEPGHEEEIDKLFASFEKIDLCLTGVGINGHIAFNEPPVEDITDEEFGKIGTRCMNIATETVVNNGANKLRGALDIFPKRCITLGMKQLLSAKKFKVYLYCAWQWGIMRKITLAPWSKSAPASYLQLHNDAEVVVTEELANFVL